MFAYNPTVNDMSGQIMGAGQLQAAATNAESMVGLGQNIGEALKSVGGSFQDAREKYEEGKGIYSAMQNVSKIFPRLKSIMDGAENLPPAVQNAMARNAVGMLGALSQFSIAELNNQTRQRAPYVDQMLDNQRDVAGGKATWTPGGGGSTPAPIEPALPEPAPAVVAPGPVASSVTDADRQRAMGWWQKRSQGGP
jgi:hypothetical protein